MDSINLQETQSTRMNYRNAAMNTSPVSCAFCGSKDYVPNVSQPNCFAALFSGIPRCKQFLEKCEENCGMPQPFFSNFPFLQIHPFLPNNTMPEKLCHIHNSLNKTEKNSSNSSDQKFGSENMKKEPPNCNKFCQREQNEFEDNHMFPKDSEKVNNKSGTESQFFTQPFFIPASTEFKMNPYLCPCNDVFSQTCNPFIVPIVSYCLFWNSLRYNNNINNFLHGFKTENPIKDQVNEFGTKPNENKTRQENDNRAFHQNSEEKVFSERSNIMSDDTTTILSSNFTETSVFSNKEEGSDDTLTEKDKTQMNDLIKEYEEESVESLKLVTKITSSSKMSSYFSTDNCVKDIESRSPPTSESVSDFKVDNSSECSMDGLLLENQDAPLNIEEPGQTSNSLLEDMHDSLEAVAAGDSGAPNSLSYRINIPPSEGSRQDKKRQETQTEETKEGYPLKDLAKTEEKKSREKNPNPRNYHAKSGIAKPATLMKIKEAKEDKKESGHDESYVMKRKHSCFPVDNTKNFRTEKQKVLCIKSQFFKKDDKDPVLKTRPYSARKLSNLILKSKKKN